MTPSDMMPSVIRKSERTISGLYGIENRLAKELYDFGLEKKLNNWKNGPKIPSDTLALAVFLNRKATVNLPTSVVLIVKAV